MKWFALFAVSLALLTGCEKNDPDRTEEDYNEEIKMPISYGHGIYYFDCYGRQFAESFLRFRKENKRLKILSVTSEAYQRDRAEGFLVITEEAPNPGPQTHETVQVHPTGVWVYYSNDDIIKEEADKKAKEIIQQHVNSLSVIQKTTPEPETK